MINTWSANFDGPREGVLLHLKEVKVQQPNGDARQLETAKAYIADQIADVDTAKFNAVKVSAYGEFDPEIGRDITHIEVHGINLALGAPKPAAPPAEAPAPAAAAKKT